ncbi:MAG TPA: hypothetical protein VFQ77_01220 [Pseudonocardiaceae bacterium]|jgi:hypothetical protein|nr:hypothetical protein [Pseudonocardiaceae bacterium]
MSTPLREVITIPQRAGAEDHLLRLTESVEVDRVAETLRVRRYPGSADGV